MLKLAPVILITIAHLVFCKPLNIPKIEKAAKMKGKPIALIS